MLLRCWYLWDSFLRYMLLRCWDPWDFLTTLQVATLLRSLASPWCKKHHFQHYSCNHSKGVWVKRVRRGRLGVLKVHTGKIDSLWNLAKKMFLAICRQRQGRTKMSCYTCVAGSGVMSAIMATCCRRQLPHWWIAEPTKSVKKIMRIHVWCTWCLPGFVKNQ